VQAALSATLLLAAGSDDWNRIRPAGDAFVISVPGMLAKRSATKDTPLGPVHTAIYSVEHGSSSYVVVYTDYSRDFLEKVGAERLFDAQQAQLVPKLRSEVSSEQTIRVGSWPGREIVFYSDDRRQITVARMSLVGERLYAVVGSTRRKGLPQDDIRRFLDSFEPRPRGRH